MLARFSPKPVKIRELHRWVAEHTKKDGWFPTVAQSNGGKVCVIGSGPAGLCCAHFLARLGYDVDLFDESKLDESLREFLLEVNVPEAVFNREIMGLMLPAIKFVGDWSLTSKEQLLNLHHKYDAVYLTIKSEVLNEESFKDLPKVLFGGKAYAKAEVPYQVVHSVRHGRKAAMIMHNKIIRQ